MTAHDSRLNAALQAAIHRIRTTVANAAARTVESLGNSARIAPNMRQRDACLAAQHELARRMAPFNQRFAEVLAERVAHEVRLVLGRASTQRSLDSTSWHSLSLVQDDEVEELVSSERLGQAIALECEWELRELSTYIGALLQTGQAEQQRNPLRAEIVGKALHRAVEAASPARDTRALLARELGRALASLMRACYADIVAELKSRGVQPVGLSVKGVEGPGNELGHEGPSSRFDSRYDTGPGEPALGLPSTGKPTGLESRPRPLMGPEFGPGHPGYEPGAFGHGASPSGRGLRSGLAPGSGYGLRGGSSYGPGGWRGDTPLSRSGLGSSSFDLGAYAYGDGYEVGYAAIDGVDPRMTALIRRLAVLGSPLVEPAADGAERRDSNRTGASAGAGPTLHPGPVAARSAQTANLIHAHRDELRQAATGALDHMVIDVVASLFDQILSDPKVPPQMARQIARLQLPVLRVALGDVGFFQTRRHPVRRFVNRIASLACAFEDLSQGPGQELIRRVRDLVQEIIGGDFEQMGLYEAKLEALESFVEQANERAVEDGRQAASLLQGKEHELRLQQRYMQALRIGLATHDMPDFMREFVTQVWSQTVMRVVQRDGPGSDAARRFRLAGRELVMSLQPKGSPTHRKQFLMKLPQLMKDLNEGMDLIGWPASAKKGFFGQLLPAHAESLKGAPLSELDYNLMASEIDALFARSVPQAGEVVQGEPAAIPELNDVVLEHRFSPAEATQIGLVPEASVDWDGTVDIEIGSDDDGPPDGLAATAAAVSPDIDLDDSGLPTPADPPEPNRGAALMSHLNIGMPYQMLLNDGWQKVRLSFVSPGRAFFVFTHGKKHQETISMTSRMVARMCTTDRLRAFESAYLMERATQRARKQLAALGAAARTASPRA